MRTIDDISMMVEGLVRGWRRHTALPQVPQLLLSEVRSTHPDAGQLVLPAEQRGAGVKVAVAMTVTVGVVAKIVVGVTPAHEQALLYADTPLQYVAYAGIAVGMTVTCLASTSRFAGARVVVTVTVTVLLWLASEFKSDRWV
jgi:hypothetical protein